MILVTGISGYIGSHVCVELLRRGYSVCGLDSLVNSSGVVISRVEKITGKRIKFYQGDVRDLQLLNQIFSENSIEAVIHFAALKAVGESILQPMRYHENNIGGLIALLSVMQSHDCSSFVFSSSATVYSPNNPIPYTELMELGATNPYGWGKIMCERILRDLEMASANFKVAYLRYFNPVGAHESGLLGEDPRGLPNNLMPIVAKVATREMEILNIYGGDWPTKDGTGVRDFIHVEDLSKGHLDALEFLNKSQSSITVNLGTGKGHSVLELVKMFEKVSGREVPFKIVERRPGDIAEYYANSELAFQLLGWKSRCDLQKMCEDVWRWKLLNEKSTSN